MCKGPVARGSLPSGAGYSKASLGHLDTHGESDRLGYVGCRMGDQRVAPNFWPGPGGFKNMGRERVCMGYTGRPREVIGRCLVIQGWRCRILRSRLGPMGMANFCIHGLLRERTCSVLGGAAGRGKEEGRPGRARRGLRGLWTTLLSLTTASTTGSSLSSSARGCPTMNFSASTKVSGKWPPPSGVCEWGDRGACTRGGGPARPQSTSHA